MGKILNIVVPMAGAGSRFIQAGYTFPKPLIEIEGKPMIQVVIENLRPAIPHRFIFICRKEHYEKYSLFEVFKNSTNDNFESIQLESMTQGAACTVLIASKYINNDNDLLIANADQVVDIDINNYLNFSRNSTVAGTIMTFETSHPKWSYARVDQDNNVIEVAEKKVISNKGTVGIYYFSQGSKFVENACLMIEKDIRTNNEFYVCPAYNELILKNEIIKIWDIKAEQMHGMGTPEDLNLYLAYLDNKKRCLFSHTAV